jgi:thymidine kinase
MMAKLYFYYSAMNAGKSTTLLQSEYNYNERGMQTLIFAPQLDDRYGAGKVTSRIGLQSDAVIFDKKFNFSDYAKEALSSHSLSCVLVDEAHFLTKDQVKQLSDISDYLSIPVLAYGIRSDFRGEPFEGSQYLLAWADKLSEIKTICHCGRKATMNSRVDEQGNVVWEGAQVQIGHDYVSTCRKHFKEGVVSREKERAN